MILKIGIGVLVFGCLLILACALFKGSTDLDEQIRSDEAQMAALEEYRSREVADGKVRNPAGQRVKRLTAKTETR